jgi:hypothetical protein
MSGRLAFGRPLTVGEAERLGMVEREGGILLDEDEGSGIPLELGDTDGEGGGVREGDELGSTAFCGS